MPYNYNKAYKHSYQGRNYSNKRMNDIKKSDNMTVFLDYMYKKYGIHSERVNDKTRQVRGIDVILGNDLKRVDEKVATDYYNKELKTYSFELSSNNNNDCHGWFEKTNFNQTTDYLLCWVKANENNDNLRKITSLECYLVNKESLWKAIKKDTGYNNINTMKSLLTKYGVCKFDKYNNVFDDSRITYQFNKNYKIVKSANLIEQPINIIISKEKLKEIAGSNIYTLEPNEYSIQNGRVICNSLKIDLDEKLESLKDDSNKVDCETYVKQEELSL